MTEKRNIIFYMSLQRVDIFRLENNDGMVWDVVRENLGTTLAYIDDVCIILYAICSAEVLFA